MPGKLHEAAEWWKAQRLKDPARMQKPLPPPLPLPDTELGPWNRPFDWPEDENGPVPPAQMSPLAALRRYLGMT